MGLYQSLVRRHYDWRLLEEQPMYVKSKRRPNKKRGYGLELVVDRLAENPDLRGESFSVYGENIPDVKENEDVEIKIDEESSYFFQDKSGSGWIPYIVVHEVAVKNRCV